MIRSLLLSVALATPAVAETALVRSGEHGTFTRLVIYLPAAQDWTLGRTEAGYSFATSAEAQPEYDLSRIWDLIPRSRLASVSVDRETGALDLRLGCDCHIFPFETQPGFVVLDVKPGAAPPASAFEAPFAMPGAHDDATPEHLAEGYDWIAGRQSIVAASGDAPSMRMPLPTGEVSLDPLHDELLEQIARGAADGIVDMVLPGKPVPTQENDHHDLPWSNIHIGELPGVIVTEADDFVEGARPETACPDPALLDLPSWGSDKPVQDLLSEARAGLYGEFDVPEPEAILRGVKALLYLGFGAEARQTAELLGNDGPEELAYYLSMARLIDGETDPQTPFGAMLGCDGPAALYAALARDRLPAGKGADRDAIVQAFVALPAHLRLHLGPSLAERFLARDDAEAARMIRDAMERSPERDAAAVALLDAKTKLHTDDPEAAQASAEEAVLLDGDGPDGLVTLVEAHFRTLDPLPAETAEALRALQREMSGTADGASIDRAVILALALSGQFDEAFQEPGAVGAEQEDLWRIVADRAADDDFLAKAVLPSGTLAPAVAPDLAETVAGRLLRLGFPDAALAWLDPVAADDPPARRRLAAEAILGRGDAGSALTLLSGLDDPAANALRARALVRMDDLPAAAQAMAAAGSAEEAVRLGPWARDWARLDPALPEPWLAAAKALETPAGSETGPLGRGNHALEATATSRAAIEALLNSVTPPSAE